MGMATLLLIWLAVALVSGVLIGAFIRAGSASRKHPARDGSPEKPREPQA